MKKFLRYSFVFLLSLMCGSISAQEVTLDFESNDWGFPEGSSNKLVEKNTYTSGGYTITLEGSEGNGYYWHNKDLYLIFGKQGAKLTLPAFDFDVEKIEVTGTNGASAAVKQNVFVGDTPISEETVGMKGVTQAYNIEGSYQAAGTIYTIQVTSAHNTQFKKIMIYKKGSGGGTISVTPPTISGTSPFEDSTEATITADGYTIYYTLDGSEPDVSSQSGSGSVTLTITETTTVKAIAVDGDGNKSIVITKTFTKKDPPAPAQDVNVAQALDLINALGTEKTSYVNDKAAFNVTGYIVEISEMSPKPEGYGNATFTIADTKGGSPVLTVFRCKDIDNEDFTDAEKIKVGDLVVVTGALQMYVKDGVGTPEVSGPSGGPACHLVSITAGLNQISADSDVNAPAYNVAGQRVNSSYKGVVVKNGKKFIK